MKQQQFLDIKSLSGFMNTDDKENIIPRPHHMRAVNIRFRGNGNNMRAENIEGTIHIPVNYPSGSVNQCIGGFFDDIVGRIIWFNYSSTGKHGIYQYLLSTGVISPILISLVNSQTDILNFSRDVYIVSANIVYQDPIDGNLLTFTDSLGRPTKLNIDRYLSGTYSPNVLRSYIDIAKAPPQMPIKAVYEYDADVKANNLNGKLFKFKYGFVYDDNDRSVTSSASYVPLPYQYNDQDITTDKRYNARINLYFATGDATVKKIEIYGTTNTGTVETDYFLITTLVKADLSIPDNLIYNYQFYNDSVYPDADIDYSILQFDRVPDAANTQELLNGNTIIYGGITEGQDLIKGTFTATVGTSQLFDKINGLLFFASQDDNDSYGTSTSLIIRLRGTGSNTAGVPTTILNANGAVFTVQAVLQNGTDVSFTYTSSTTSIATILAGLLAAAVVKGFTGSVSGTTLTITQTNVILLTSYAVQDMANITYTNNILYAYQAAANYTYGIQYFGTKGFTNGVVTTANLSITTPPIDPTDLNNYPFVTFTINGRPPLWAKYYHIVRTPNLTYSKQLYWVTKQAFSNVSASSSPPNKIAYIDISNMEYYNSNIVNTSNYVSYDYAPGDMVRFMARYSTTGAVTVLSTNLDYEILGVSESYNQNGIVKTGRFIRIQYPTNQIDTNFKFDGTDDFQNYQIFIYNERKKAADEENVFWEFAEQYPIGNPFTATAYHIGNRVTQSSNLGTPATNTLYYGDEFLRYRNVPTGNEYQHNASDVGFDNYTALQIDVPTTVSTTNYEIETQLRQPVADAVGGYPFNNSADYYYRNKTSGAVNSQFIRLRGTIPIYNNTDATSGFIFNALITAAQSPFALKTIIPILVNLPVKLNVVTEYSFDVTLSVPPTGRVWLATNPTVGVSFNALVINPFVLTIDIVQNTQIEIIEPSFSDSKYIGITSNNRPTEIDINAKRTYYSTRLRWGKDDQQGTNLNNLNRFYPLNLDEIDRQKGDVLRLKARDRILRVFQSRACGQMGIYSKFIQDSNSQNILTTTDNIITTNNVQYYEGEFGLGNAPYSLVSGKIQDYFVDVIRGYQIRLSGDGLQPISELYKGQFYIEPLFTPYNKTWLRTNGSTAKILGFYDYFEEQYNAILQGGQNGTDTIDSYTFSFNEKRNAYCSFYDFHPEYMLSAEDRLFSFVDGQLYEHSNTDEYCKFYGEQFYPSIILPFNDQEGVKKKFNHLSYQSNKIWTASDLETFTTNENIDAIVTSFFNPQTGFQQTSRLKDFNFELFEGLTTAALLRDINSNQVALEGLYEGDYLEGFWLKIKLSYKGSDFSYIYLPTIEWEVSNRNF